jgi:predicted SnoaL-like aldol condensation-catalyzing enzyme
VTSAGGSERTEQEEPQVTPSLQSEQSAKRIVLDFFDLAFVQRKPAEAAERYLGAEYKQHNPLAPDGPEAFVGFIGVFQEQAPEMSFDIKRVVAEDDLVVLHYHLKMTPDDLGQAVVDIFRVEDGRVVEHWDVLQPVPAESANTNTMF